VLATFLTSCHVSRAFALWMSGRNPLVVFLASFALFTCNFFMWYMIWSCSDAAYMLDSQSNLGEQGTYLLADGLHHIPNLKSLDIGYHSRLFCDTSSS
jgi:hypothetical protein